MGIENMRGYKYKPALILMAWVFFFFVAVFQPGPVQAENRALLIGIGSYANGINLPGIDIDLQNMKQAARMMGFEDQQVKVLMNADASLTGIRRAIHDWLVQGVHPEDRVLFYFSGHGSQVEDENGDESDGADEVLLPFDAEAVEKSLKGAFLDDEFNLLLAGVPAGEILVFLDACHSGTATRGIVRTGDTIVPKVFEYEGMPTAKGNFAVEETAANANYIALSACRDDEEALASGKGSFLTRGILNTLDDASWHGTPVTMAQFQKNTARFIARDLHLSGRTQHPQITGNRRSAGSYVIAVKKENPWARLEELVAAPAHSVWVRTGVRVRVNETLEITCRAGRSGYLNVMNIDAADHEAIVLFPNRLHPDNRVGADTVLAIPGDKDNFELIARPPAGKSMIVVFLTEKKINAYQDGGGHPAAVFRRPSTQTLRRLQAEKQRRPQLFGAGSSVMEIVE